MGFLNHQQYDWYWLEFVTRFHSENPLGNLKASFHTSCTSVSLIFCLVPKPWNFASNNLSVALLLKHHLFWQKCRTPSGCNRESCGDTDSSFPCIVLNRWIPQGSLNGTHLGEYVYLGVICMVNLKEFPLIVHWWYNDPCYFLCLNFQSGIRFIRWSHSKTFHYFGGDHPFDTQQSKCHHFSLVK